MAALVLTNVPGGAGVQGALPVAENVPADRLYDGNCSDTLTGGSGRDGLDGVTVDDTIDGGPDDDQAIGTDSCLAERVTGYEGG